MENPLGNHRKSRGGHWETIGKSKEHVMGRTRDFKEILRQPKENQKEHQRGNHRKTKGGTIGGAIGKPQTIKGAPFAIRRKLMESTWDC